MQAVQLTLFDRQKNQCFPRSQRLFSECRQPQEQIFCSFLPTEQFLKVRFLAKPKRASSLWSYGLTKSFDGIGLFYEIDFNHIVKTLLTDLPNGKGLTNLSGSCYQQRTSVVE